MTVPKRVREWMLEQLHLTTDNLHIHNMGQSVLLLSLYTWNSRSWDEKSIGKLEPTDHQWITLSPLSAVFPWQQRPTGESVLVVRVDEESLPEIRPDLASLWRVDNVHNLPLQMAIYEPSNSFSRNAPNKLWYTKTLGKGNQDTGMLQLGDTHWEYWFEDEILRKPLP